MSRLAGFGGAVYVGTQVISDTTAAWAEYTGTGVTSTLDTSDYKVNAGSAKMVCDATTGVERVATKAVTSMNLSTYTEVMGWFKSSVNLSASDWGLMMDDTASCASPIVTLNMPAMTANTWAFVKLAASLGSATAIISVGMTQAVDKGAMSFWVNYLTAAKTIAGIKTWNLDYKYSVVNATGFDSGGAAQFVGTITEWSGKFDGFKDGAPLSVGTLVALELQESSTATQQWRGNAFVTSVSAAVPVDGLVTYAYTFQGTGPLTTATT